MPKNFLVTAVAAACLSASLAANAEITLSGSVANASATAAQFNKLALEENTKKGGGCRMSVFNVDSPDGNSPLVASKPCDEPMTDEEIQRFLFEDDQKH